MFDFHDVHDVIFYDKDGNKLFQFDKVESLNIDMSASAEDKKLVKAAFENENTKNLDETIIGIFEKLDQDKLEQEKKECCDYYFGDAYWRKNNLDKPILTNSTKEVSKYKELFGGDKEWQQ